jgi:hypothetical protein
VWLEVQHVETQQIDQRERSDIEDGAGTGRRTQRTFDATPPPRE